MTMITEDFVSFKTANLLKEKGFDEKCRYVWVLDKANDPKDNDGVYKVSSPYFMEGESYVSNEDIDRVLKYYDEYYNKSAFLCPTLSIVMKWLREVYNFHIWVEPNHDKEGLYNAHVKVGWWSNNWGGVGYNTYEQACEAAILYCLKNLI